MPKKIKWEKVEEELFEMYALGLTLKEAAKKIKINYVTVVHHMNRPHVMERYGQFIKTKKYQREKMNRIPKKRIYQEAPAPPPQNRAEKFRDELKIGDKVRNRLYFEKGVVIAKYPYIFSIKTTSGFISSYTYNSFMEF